MGGIIDGFQMGNIFGGITRDCSFLRFFFFFFFFFFFSSGLLKYLLVAFVWECCWIIAFIYLTEMYRRHSTSGSWTEIGVSIFFDGNT